MSFDISDGPTLGSNSPTVRVFSNSSTIEVSSALSRHQLNPILDHPEPNSHYVVDERYHYFYDDLARPTWVEGPLTKKTAQRNPKAQFEAGGTDRLPSDQGSHLIARRFYGHGLGGNLSAMHRGTNGIGLERSTAIAAWLDNAGVKGWAEGKGQWFDAVDGTRTSDMTKWNWWDMEDFLGEALKNNKNVSIAMSIHYEGDSQRFSQIALRYRIDNGPIEKIIFSNDPQNEATGNWSRLPQKLTSAKRTTNRSAMTRRVEERIMQRTAGNV